MVESEFLESRQKKAKIAPLLFLGLLCAVLGLFISSNYLKLISLVFCFLYVFVPAKRSHKYYGKKIEIYLWIPIAVGLLFIGKNDPVDIFRDLTFFLIPCLFFMAGRKFFEQNGDIKKLIFYFSSIYCWVFLCVLCYYWFDQGFLGVLTIRDLVSPGSFLLVYCIYFMYEREGSWRDLMSRPLFITAQLIFLAQFSRTYFIILLIFFFFSSKKIWNAKILLSLILVIAVLFLFAMPFGIENIIAESVHKALTELDFKDVWTPEEMGTSYRSYEMSIAYAAFTSYSFINMIFGDGLGALLHLDFPMVLAGIEYDAIPWMHNGYFYALLKTGIVGIFCYFIFMMKVYSGPYKKNSDLFGKRLIKVTVIGLLFSTIVINGFFSNESVFAYIILGFFSSSRMAKSNLVVR